jgi:1,4-dihydroxy-2-naphthoyl-CoA hydrolase
MALWKHKLTPADIRQLADNTLIRHLDIQIIEIGEDFVKASMPVDHRTHQPMGILHGGASVALAETIGSFAAQMCAEPGHFCVGLEINANHIRSVREGLVYGIATPIHIGRSTQVWNIRIADEQDKTVCVSRLTMSVLKS